MALLFLKVIVGGLIYAGCIITMWWVAGWPDGAESYLLQMIRRRLTEENA